MSMIIMLTAIDFRSTRNSLYAMVLCAANPRDEAKIMIGGGQIDDEIGKYTGADAYFL